MAAFLFGAMEISLARSLDGEGLPEGAWVLLFALLSFGAFSLGSMFKDYKDIDQDREAGIGTIYTRYLSKGRSLESIHWFVIISTTVMLLVPPVWLYVLDKPLKHSIVLLVLALIPALLLKLMKNPKTAVGATLWAFNAYFMVLALIAPKMV